MTNALAIRGAGGGGGKGGGGNARAPQEAPDSLRSVQYARVLHLLGEGEIEGLADGMRSVYLDDTPLQNADGSWNFNGANVEWRTGTPGQPPIAGFSSSESESPVGVEVKVTAAVVRSFTNANADAVRVTIGVPSLSVMDTQTGDLSGTAVRVCIDVQRNSAGWVTVIDDSISGKTTSRYQRSYRISLGRFGARGGTYDVRVRRITPDATTSNVANRTTWESFTEIVEHQLRYPHSALVGVQVDATQFRNIPRVAFDARLLRVQVPVNYDPATRSCNGFWSGEFKMAWTDNPAWCVYDLATHPRYGLGEYIPPALLDKWTLYEIARYCDELVPDGLGGMEPRYRCNVFLQTRAEAIKVLQHFAGIFNGLVFWSGGMLTMAADKPEAPVALFTAANVIDGDFTYAGTPLNQRHTTALVTWNDPSDRYRQRIEYVEDAEGVAQWGVREAQVVAFGCTSRGQAHRVGKWLLLTERYLSETITFKTGINAALLRPGEVFRTADPHRAGIRHGGRLLDATATWVKLDAAVEMETSAAYELTVQMPDGRLETRSVVAQYGTTDELTVIGGFSAAPASMAIWGLSSTSVKHELWRALSVTEVEDGNIQISGVAYRPDKYAAIEHNLQLQPVQTIAYNPFVQRAPTELRAVESLYLVSPQLVGSRVTFSWLAPPNAVKFRVIAQRENDTPTYFDVPLPSVDIQPAQPGHWRFSVVAINAMGTVSSPATLEQDLVGLDGPPGNVEDFQLDILSDRANLAWRPAVDLDVLIGGQICIRHTPKQMLAKWEDGTEMARFAGGSSSGIVPLLAGTYLAKFVDSNGNHSPRAALVVSTTGPLRDYNVVELLNQHPHFPGEKSNLMVDRRTLSLVVGANGRLVSLAGEYVFDRIVDLGQRYMCQCTAHVEASSFVIGDSVDTWNDVDAVADIDGTPVDEGGVMVMVSTTDVDPAHAQWSEWRRLVVADLSFRAVRFKAVFTSAAPECNVALSELSVLVDVPDRIESRNNMPIPAGGLRISFGNAFRGTPSIAIVAQDLSTGDRWEITRQSDEGFHIAFHDSIGNPVAKTCDWIARGYGYRH